MAEIDPTLALLIAAASDENKAKRIGEIKDAETALELRRVDVEKQAESVRSQADGLAQRQADFEETKKGFAIQVGLLEDEKKRIAAVMAEWDAKREQWEQLRRQVEEQHVAKDSEQAAKHVELSDRETAVAEREAHANDIDAEKARLQGMIEGAKKWLEAVEGP